MMTRCEKVSGAEINTKVFTFTKKINNDILVQTEYSYFMEESIAIRASTSMVRF